MSILREFIVRYRASGHIRFQIPARVCAPDFSAALTTAIAAIPGVYRVRVYEQQCKLSIRFDESVCSFKSLATQMAALLRVLEQPKNKVEKVAAKVGLKPKLLTKVGDKFKSLKAGQWLQAKYSDAKETVQAAKVITKLSLKQKDGLLQNPEQAVINFLNDILVLYLVKSYWQRVVTLWIPNPLKYRYEWLTVSYLLYLWLRSRNKLR